MTDRVTRRTWTERAVESIVRWRVAVLGVALLVTLAAIPASLNLRFERSIESFYAPDDPHLINYRESKSLFGGDEFVVVAFTDPQLFDADGGLNAASADRIRDLSKRLSAIPGVEPESTQNLADALTLDALPLLNKPRERLLELLRGALVGDDNQTTAVIVRMRPVDQTDTPRAETIAQIRDVAANFPLPTYVVGEPVLIHDTFRYVEQDGAMLGWVSTGLLILVIGIIFRRLRWIILPVLVVEVTIVWTKAILAIADFQLTMVSSVLNSLLMVIGIATVMHVTVLFREQRARLTPVRAARFTLASLAAPIFWTTTTTAAGFAAQLPSDVLPIRSFGLMMGLGAMLVFFASAAILPGGILLGRHEPVQDKGERAGWIGRALTTLNRWVESHPGLLSLVCLSIVAFSLLGMIWLRVETDFSKNFRANTPIVRALNVVENKLGGASIWQVSFPAPKELNAEFVDRVRKVAQQLRELDSHNPEQLTKVMALSDGIDLVPLLPLPAKRALLRQIQPEFESSLYNAEQGRMRIVLRARERQRSEDRLKVIQEVERVAKTEFPEAKASGLFVLLTFLTDSLLGDQWTSFAIGATMIISLMTIAFRSLKIGLVSLIPNLLPIVFVIGTMGWLGLPISMGTAMISSVSMGLTVDSSIHYFAGYRRALQQGNDVLGALRITNQGVGTALIYTNIALIIGFLALTISHFMPLVYFGLLVSVAMLGGLIGNLILLPLLIRAFRIR